VDYPNEWFAGFFGRINIRLLPKSGRKIKFPVQNNFVGIGTFHATTNQMETALKAYWGPVASNKSSVPGAGCLIAAKIFFIKKTPPSGSTGESGEFESRLRHI